jgi:hypothetical protein
MLLEHKQMRDFAPGAPSGWRRLLADCHRALAAIDPGYRTLAVRERLGTLTIIVESSMPLAQAAIDGVTSRHEDHALTVCQFCAKPGEHGGWDSVPAVRCRDCAGKIRHGR